MACDENSKSIALVVTAIDKNGVIPSDALSLVSLLCLSLPLSLSLSLSPSFCFSAAIITTQRERGTFCYFSGEQADSNSESSAQGLYGNALYVEAQVLSQSTSLVSFFPDSP